MAQLRAGIVMLFAVGLTGAGTPPKARTSTIARATTHASPARVLSYETESCPSCHDALLGRAALHGVFNTGGGCPDCHVPAPAAKTACTGPLGVQWALVEEDPALCGRCHGIEGAAKNLHPVIASLGCSSCHDPHSSDFPKALKKLPGAPLCLYCHEQEPRKSVHTAVKEGSCLDCHEAHRGRDGPLLNKPRKELCVGACHRTEDLAKGLVLHTPVLEGRCVECHDPHASDFPKQTYGIGRDLCMRCHDAANGKNERGQPKADQKIDLRKKSVHKPLIDGACDPCHESVHASNSPKFLKKPPPDVCYDCHDHQDKTVFVHGAVKLGECADCHNPHASDAANLARDVRTADLCFRCHSDDVTGRRSVHRPVAAGTCNSCHHPHGSDLAFNLIKPPTAAACLELCHEIVNRERRCNPLTQRCDRPILDPVVKHAPMQKYGCIACHDPHGAQNPELLIKPVNELCQTCHEDHKDGYHVSSIVSGGHPISRSVDPHEPEIEMSCASCHNPHGSENPKLLYYGSSPLESCDWCHGDKSGKRPELKNIVIKGRLIAGASPIRGRGAGGGAPGAGPDTAPPRSAIAPPGRATDGR